MKAFLGLGVFFIVAAFFLPVSAHAAVLAKPVNNFSLTGFWPLDEGSGTTARDMSGNGQNGTLTSSPTWTTGKKEGALTFGASSNYVVTTRSWATATGTIALWVYPTSYSDWISPAGWKLLGATNGYILLDEGGSGTPGKWRAVFRPDVSGASEAAVVATANITQNTWTYLAMTWALSGGTYTIHLYVNGVDQGSATWTGTPGAGGVGNFHFGNSGDFPDNYFIGKVDDVRTYGRVLSSSEVKSLYSTQAQVRAPSNLGLVGSWNFDEGAGTIAGDTSSNKNNGTLSGSTLPTWVGGKHGKALSFDGSSSYITTGNNASMGLSGKSFTISAWVNTKDATTNGSVYDAWQSPFSFRLFTTAGTVAFQLRNTSAADMLTGNWISAPIAANQWYHVVAVYNYVNSTTGTAYLYLNGALATSAVCSAANCTLMDNIGTIPRLIGKKGDSANYFNGTIDDVRVYSRVLSAAEVGGLYGQGATQAQTSSVNLTTDSTLGSGLVGLWTFDGLDTTDKIYDRSGAGNDGYVGSGGVATSTMKKIGKLGQAFYFSGATSQYVEAGGFSSLGTNNQPYTLSAWIKPISVSETGDIIHVSSAQAGTGWCLSMLQIVSGKALALSWPMNTITGATSLLPGTWYHVVHTWDASGGLQLYVNGVPDGSAAQATFSASGSSNYVTIGSPIPTGTGCASDTGTGFAGTIDDVRVYSRSLSATEVKRLYLLGQ